MSRYSFLGRPISGRFTIPSGILTVTLDTLERLARAIPALGILTTKSIGPAPRSGNPEPVYVQVEKGSYVNAVGLANPGCEAFAGELAGLQMPADKFLLVSIFGGSPEEFQKVARTLSPFAGGFELNFSCPHARGYGQEIGNRAEVACEYLKAVQAATAKPILPKLSPNVGDLQPLAEALIQAGASGFTVVNTLGPIEFREKLTGQPVLSNRIGGVSGSRVRLEALRCVRQVAAAVRRSGRQIPIIGMGGISSTKDVREFESAGADFFGVGSALTGLNTCQVSEFFAALERGDAGHTPPPDDFMRYRKLHVRRVEQPADDLKILWAGEDFHCRPGQFVFLWLPGGMEKPFAPAFDEPAALVVRRVGPFTSRLFGVKEGDAFYLRGPYGVGFNPEPRPAPEAYALIGGGTGVAPLLLLAKSLRQRGVLADSLHVFLGGRNARQICFQEEFGRYGTLHVATEDGSLGFRGLVTQCLEEHLRAHPGALHHFYNCGPEKMEARAFEIERAAPHTGIETSVERYMKCGVGICGICALDGWRTCVDGPVLGEEILAASNQFGRLLRTKTGGLVDEFTSASAPANSSAAGVSL
ncbi:MAG: dihydroorotate dehydrogenase [Planctomycetes bacterium]|nr:dihydroorotate dehydrogenase [Planctomycetota bacterium]